MQTQLFFNGAATDPASALVRSASNNQAAARPCFVLGDNPELEIYVTDGAGGFDTQSGDATVTPWLGIGTPGGAPSSGTFWLGVSSATSGTLHNGSRYYIQTYVAGDDFTNCGASANETGEIFTKTNGSPTSWANGSTLVEITTDLTYNATAAQVESALEATEALTGVSVTKNGSAPVWVIEWDDVGAVSALIGGADSLSPSSACVVSELQAGSASARERQLVRLTRQPYALQTTWDTVTDGWTARLDCNTRGLLELLDGAASANSTLELQLVDADGNIRTVGQVQCLVRNEAIDPNSTTALPLASYLTAEQARLAFVQNRYAVTALTGGGTALDGIATGTTASQIVATNSMFAIEISDSISFYELVSGTDAESSPDVIRPDDYDGTDNARVWKLLTVGAAYQNYVEGTLFSVAPTSGAYLSASAIGSGAQANANYALSFGRDCIVSASQAANLGGSSNAASAQSAITLGGSTNAASGAYSATLAGVSNSASAQSAVAIGERAIADIPAAFAIGGGNSVAANANQVTRLIGVLSTGNSTPAAMTASDGSGRFTLRANTLWTFSILVSARQQSGLGHASWRVFGAIYRNSLASSTAILGDIELSPNSANESDWDFTVQADTTNGALKLLCTGDPSATVYWTALIDISEVTRS